MGIDSPRVRWGIHPELLEFTPEQRATDNEQRALTFFYPAGFLSKRKPVAEVLKAFRRYDDPNAKLVIKGQVEREVDLLRRGAERDPRVEVVLEDLPTDEHLRLFAAADVCVAPSRWEGLGLHLYESMALGLPVITNDAPPMNEVIADGDNGLLIASRRRGGRARGSPRTRPASAGWPARSNGSPSPGSSRALREGVARARERLAWSHTVADYGELIDRFA